MSNIKQIEFARGPGSALYGPNAFSAVINIITFRPEEINNTVGFTVGSFDTTKAKLDVQHRNEFFSGSLSLNTQDSNGWDINYQQSTGAQQENSLEHDSYSVLAQIHSGPFSMLLYDNTLKGNTYGHSIFSSILEFEDESTFINTKFDYQLMDQWQINAQLSWHESINIAIKSEEWNFDIENQIELSKHQAVWGINITKLEDVGSIKNNPLNVNLRPWDREQYTGYGQLNYNLKQTQFVIGGQWLKFEKLDSETVPRFGVIRQFGEAWTLRIFYNEAYRAPNAIDTSLDLLVSGLSFQGNPTIKPEHVKTSEIQLAYYRAQYDLALTLFKIKQEDIIVSSTDQATLISSPDNLEEKEFEGAELEGHFRSGPWSVQGAISYQENEGNDISFGLSNVSNITTIPHTLIKLGVIYKQEEWSSGIFCTYTNEYLSNDVFELPGVKANVNPTAGDHYNITANWRWAFGRYLGFPSDRLSTSLYIHNLLDEEFFVNDFNTPQPPRPASVNTIPASPERSYFLSLDFQW